MFKKRFSNQVPLKFPKARNEKVANPNPLKGRGTSSPNKKPTYVSVERSIMVLVLLGHINALVMGKFGTRFQISLM